MKDQYVIYGMVFLMIILFGGAATDKMYHFEMFLSSLRAMGLKGRLPGIIAVLVPVLEFMIAVWLCLTSRVFRVFLVTGVLLSGYCVYTAYKVAYFPGQASFFTGVLTWLPWPAIIAVNLSLAAFSFLAATFEKAVIPRPV